MTAKIETDSAVRFWTIASGAGLDRDDSEMALQVTEIARNGLGDSALIAASA
jgi:hypothetical protein